MRGNRVAAVAERLGPLLVAWLGTLPGEWEGTPRQLADAVEAFNRAGRFFALVPRSGWSGVLERHADTIRSAGWRVVQRRTAGARLITFTEETTPDHRTLPA